MGEWGRTLPQAGCSGTASQHLWNCTALKDQMAALPLGPAMNFEGVPAGGCEQSLFWGAHLQAPQGLCNPGHPQAGRQLAGPGDFSPCPEQSHPLLTGSLSQALSWDPRLTLTQLSSSCHIWLPGSPTWELAGPQPIHPSNEQDVLLWGLQDHSPAHTAPPPAALLALGPRRQPRRAGGHTAPASPWPPSCPGPNT